MQTGKIVKERPSISLHCDRVKMLYEHIQEGTLSYYFWSIALLSILKLDGVSTLNVAFLGVLLLVIQLVKSRYMEVFFSLKSIDSPYRWENYMVAASFAQAFIVSAGVMFLIDLQQNLATYVLITLIVIPAFVSALVLIASVRTHYAWLLGLLLPIALKCGLSDDPIYWIFAGLIIFGGVPSSALVGKKISESFVDTLQLRFENSELLAQAQQEKERAEAERARAEKASSDKMRFLASASHDLRQPIHALELFSDALEHELDKPIQQELMSKMKESTSAMNGLLYSLLDISRLDAGVVQVSKTNLLVNDLLGKLIQAVQSQADKKGVNILFEASPCAVVSDAVLLESILHNLLSNAVKYTHQGAITILCTTTTTGEIALTIADTGIGISEDDKQAVFDEFIQLGNSERDRSKGLGLGLAIVKRTCALLGHEISMQSELEQGSTFTLFLEKAEMDDVQVQTQSAFKPSQMDATILVVDDEKAILEGMEKMLSRWGCRVLIAVSLQEALEQLQAKPQRIDLIVADYRLSEGKLGTDAVAQLTQILDAPDLPAIIITGDTGSEQLKAIEDAGYSVLHKPVAAVRVRALMQSLLKGA